MFVDTADVMSGGTSYQEILIIVFGVVDIEWSLGGRLDRTSVALVYLRVKMIKIR